jgi:hypothetical protein
MIDERAAGGDKVLHLLHRLKAASRTDPRDMAPAGDFVKLCAEAYDCIAAMRAGLRDVLYAAHAAADDAHGGTLNSEILEQLDKHLGREGDRP